MVLFWRAGRREAPLKMGIYRFVFLDKIIKINDSDNILNAEYQELPDTQKPSSTTHKDALARTLEDTFNQYVKLNKKIKDAAAIYLN